MEKIYSKVQDKTEKIEAKKETIDFILNFSKSLKITQVKGIQFESNIN